MKYAVVYEIDMPKSPEKSMEVMWQLFRFGNPGKSIKQFNVWFDHLREIQKEILPCPWCGIIPELLVVKHTCDNEWPEDDLRHHVTKVADPDRLVYRINCEQGNCPVRPKQVNYYDTPEEARDKWRC